MRQKHTYWLTRDTKRLQEYELVYRRFHTRRCLSQNILTAGVSQMRASGYRTPSHRPASAKLLGGTRDLPAPRPMILLDRVAAGQLRNEELDRELAVWT